MCKRIVGLDPIVFKDSRVLILGSMPSVISLKEQMYYANKTNRFWKVLEAIYQENDKIKASFGFSNLPLVNPVGIKKRFFFDNFCGSKCCHAFPEAGETNAVDRSLGRNMKTTPKIKQLTLACFLAVTSMMLTSSSS